LVYRIHRRIDLSVSLTVVWSLVSSTLYRLGRWAFRARRLVLAVWLVVLVLAGGGAALLYQGTDDTFSLPGTESGAALEQLRQTFPQVSGASAQLVVVAPDGATVTAEPSRVPSRRPWRPPPRCRASPRSPTPTAPR
jgi:hypothetical protein